jgi:hypothetical protein
MLVAKRIIGVLAIRASTTEANCGFSLILRDSPARDHIAVVIVNENDCIVLEMLIQMLPDDIICLRRCA